MGITGLLPLLRSIHKPTHVRTLAGQTIGIDAYGWLHRGTIACAIELAQGKPTRKHIEFALHRVRMLIHFGVKPYLVFDGDYLPSKAHTEKGRAARRKESKRVGLDLLRMGRQAQAYQELQKAIDVTPVMARELIEELKRLDVPYVVAPFEADSQLAYLEQQGIISGVLSEDSDLLVFGVKRLFTKLDQYGDCVMIDRADFTACRDISLVGWSDKEFRMMAMLSGCDYLPSIAGLGLKTTYRLVRKHKDLEKVIRAILFDGKKTVPPGYLDAFTNAERTFLYQWVFCPETRSLRHLNPLPAGLTAEDMPFLGKEVAPEEAAGVACGDLDPNTKQPIVLPQRFSERATQQRVVSTPIEKHGKTIEAFFSRTPLAELDPNSFTPSPSQQRLIQSQTNVSWSASQVQSTRITAINRSLSVSVPSSAPQPSRAPRLTSRFSVPGEAPKRQRLCSDPAIGLAMEGGVSLESGTVSRFFGQGPTQDSPTVRKKPSRRGEDEFELWSDDSIAQALAETSAMPEVSTSDRTIVAPRKRKKLSVFNDTQASPEETPAAAPEEDSQSSSVSLESTQAVFSQPETPSASITDDSQTSLFGSLDRFRNPTSTSTSSLSRETSFTKQEKSTPAMRRTQSYPISSTHSSAVSSTHDNADDEEADDEEVDDEVDGDKIQVGASSPPQQHQPSPSSSKLPSSRALASIRNLAYKHNLPSFTQPSKSNSSAAVAVATALDADVGSGLGSEDMIIPNSPPFTGGRDDHDDFCDETEARDDDGEQNEDGNEEKISFREKLNLGRFLFAG